MNSRSRSIGSPPHGKWPSANLRTPGHRRPRVPCRWPAVGWSPPSRSDRPPRPKVGLPARRPFCPRRPFCRGQLGSRRLRAGSRGQGALRQALRVGSHAAGGAQRVHVRRPDPDHQRGAADRAELLCRSPRIWARSSCSRWASSSPPTPASPMTAGSRWCTATRPSNTSSSGRSPRSGCRIHGVAAMPRAPAGVSTPAPTPSVSTARVWFCTRSPASASSCRTIRVRSTTWAARFPSAQMRRGDVIFWGPNGSQHVAIFLGNGQMIEAPYTGLIRQDLPGPNQRHDPLRRALHRVVR